jgi:Arc/MetJ-type ribon-helix-helix transcriptional regulator
MTRKPRIVTFRLDQATGDRMRELVPYTRYGNTSSFIREGIDLLLKREDVQPSGWSAHRHRVRPLTRLPKGGRPVSTLLSGHLAIGPNLAERLPGPVRSTRWRAPGGPVTISSLLSNSSPSSPLKALTSSATGRWSAAGSARSLPTRPSWGAAATSTKMTSSQCCHRLGGAGRRRCPLWIGLCCKTLRCAARAQLSNPTERRFEIDVARLRSSLSQYCSIGRQNSFAAQSIG